MSYIELCNACYDNDIIIAKKLINEGADVNKYYKFGVYPIHIACMNLCYDLVKLLIENGANANERRCSRMTPLQVAVQSSTLSIFRYGKYFAVDNLSNSCDIIKLLIANGASVNDTYNSNNTPLHDACHIPNIDVAKILLENGANVNAYKDPCHNKTPLYVACTYGNIEVIKLLLEYGADINDNNNCYGISSLERAYICCKINDINNVNNVDIVEFLLENGADVNIKNSQGNTILHDVCCHSNNVQLFKLLLKYGANINVVNNKNETLLHKAVKFTKHNDNEIFIVEQLLKLGANPNAKDIYGDTPLHIACSHNCTFLVIKLLLEYGAGIHIKNNAGITPFMKIQTVDVYWDCNKYSVVCLMKNMERDNMTEKLHALQKLIPDDVYKRYIIKRIYQ